METLVQNKKKLNIPKPSLSSTTICQTPFKEQSKAENNSNNNLLPSSSNLSPPEFDLNSPCRYFKSSFARSLSLSGKSQIKSLDFDINFGLPNVNNNNNDNNNVSISPEEEEYYRQTTVDTGNRKSLCGSDGSQVNSMMCASPLPSQFLRTSNGVLKRNHLTPVACGIISAEAGGKVNDNTNTINTNSSTTNNNNNSRKKVWSTSHKQNFHRRSLDTSEIEILKLKKECQGLLEENRRLTEVASHCAVKPRLPECPTNIEVIILQNQVDTLQWQLKQVGTSFEMYRAVMEEVVRFLERYQNLNSLKNEQILRSKSMHRVYPNEITMETSNLQSCTRTRSSTNLIDFHNKSNNHSYEESLYSPNNSNYTNFRDFTWRRSPKRSTSSQVTTAEQDPEKLCQEGFRLLRTVQNLISTQQPDLAQRSNNLKTQHNSHHSQSNLNENKQMTPSTAAQSEHNNFSFQTDREPLCALFVRKLNMRESRLSLRSSTDSSVHSSSSSSKTGTDEENYSVLHNKETHIGFTTEDESGFSSISSFQEIGLPLNSTMISNASICRNTALEEFNECNTDFCLDSRNSTLKASHTSTMSDVGLPRNHIHHEVRWDLSPTASRRHNIHRFSTLSNDDSSAVLWV